MRLAQKERFVQDREESERRSKELGSKWFLLRKSETIRFNSRFRKLELGVLAR